MSAEIGAGRLAGQGFRGGGVGFGIVWVPESFRILKGLIFRSKYRMGSWVLSFFCGLGGWCSAGRGGGFGGWFGFGGVGVVLVFGWIGFLGVCFGLGAGCDGFLVMCGGFCHLIFSLMMPLLRQGRVSSTTRIKATAVTTPTNPHL